MRDMVLVLNFGDASSRAVTRKLRAERVLCKIVPGETPLEEIMRQEPMGLILAGGSRGAVPGGMDQRLWQAGLPVLALGDAALILLKAFGGDVGERRLAGAIVRLDYDADCPLFKGLESGERMLHCAHELALPQALRPVCRGQEITVGFSHESLPAWGLQFEMEQNDPEASQLLCNFALNVCGCTTWWDDDAFVTRAVEEIGRVAGGGRAVCVMTGGLDSGVSALLAYKALGRRLKGIFVDTGLLREGEAEAFMAFYRDSLGMEIQAIDAGERFLAALAGVSDTEEKRRRISAVMQEILREAMEAMGGFDAAISGVCCNDILYAGGREDPLPAGMEIPVIEPVRDLFKDEIRRIGSFLGIPPRVLSCQPFPGGGLALRILGPVTWERLATLRTADAVFRTEIHEAGLDKKLWQYFALLAAMPGGGSGEVVCLRAVNTGDRTPAYAARLPYDVMETTADRILKEAPGVRRVVYDLTPSAHEAGIEWQ